MSYRPEIKSDANGTTQDLPIDAETVQGKIPVFTTTNQIIEGVKTYNGNQIFKGYLDIRGTAAEKHLKTRGIGGSDGNGNESDLYLQYNSNYSTKFGKSGNGSLNSDGTITEAGTLLSKKYASKSNTLSGYGITDAYTKTETDNKLSGKSNVGHTHESILDYGDTNKTIKIGYSGAGLTASQIGYIAGYTSGANDNEHKIKDISKDVLKSWLGYAEVATGTIRYNSLNIANGTYLWIVYPTSGSATSFSFTADNSTYTGYHFAIIQSGTPGSVRYFTNPTTLARVMTTSVASSGEVHYVRFKIE